MPERRDDAWRVWIREGVPRGAILAGGDDPVDRAGESEFGVLLHRRAGAAATEELLVEKP